MPSQLHHFQPARSITGTAGASHQQPLSPNSCPSVSSLQHIPTQSHNPTATTMITMIPTQELPILLAIQDAPKPNPPPGIFVVYLLKFCDPRVSRCYGCGYPIKIESLANIPPSDLVIVAKLFREYRKDGQPRVSSEFSNTYVHANLQCLQKKLPHFLPSFLQIPQHIHPHSSILHRQHLVSLTIFLHQFKTSLMSCQVLRNI